MAGSGVVKHILLARFKDEVTPERLDQLIRGYAGLVAVVPSMKAFHCAGTLTIFCPSSADVNTPETSLQSEPIRELLL